MDTGIDAWADGFCACFTAYASTLDFIHGVLHSRINRKLYGYKNNYEPLSLPMPIGYWKEK